MERRLRNRNTDCEEKIKERVKKAEKELKFAKDFDVVLVNDNLEKAQAEAYNLVKNFVN
jgi:guanylate kinase